MPEYVQVQHGEAGFDFANDSTTDLERGHRFKVGDLLCVLKSSVPGYSAMPSSTNPNNAKIWQGRAHLLLHDDARQWDVYLDAPLGADHTFGQPVILDGEHVGYAIPHPGPDAGNPGAGEYATPTTTNPAPVVARAADSVIRIIATAPVGNVTSNPTIQPKAGIIGTIVAATTRAQLNTLISTEATAEGGALTAMSAVGDTAGGDINLDTPIGATADAAIAAWSDGATLAVKNTGTGNILYTDPVAGNVLTIEQFESITIRRYGNDFRVE